MMITDFAALTIRLPLLDRATLSQAWRDALHASHLRPRSAAARSLAVSASAKTGPVAPDGRIKPPMLMTSPPSHSAPRTRSAFIPGVERMGASPRSRCIRPPKPRTMVKAVSREQFSVTLANGERLCVLVASGRQGLIVTLLCAAHLQDDMRRALARLARGFAPMPIQVRVMGAMEGGSWKA